MVRLAPKTLLKTMAVVSALRNPMNVDLMFMTYCEADAVCVLGICKQTGHAK